MRAQFWPMVVSLQTLPPECEFRPSGYASARNDQLIPGIVRVSTRDQPDVRVYTEFTQGNNMKNIKTGFAGKPALQAALVAILGTLAFAPTAGMAQSQPDINTWHNPSGNIVKNSTGLCWRSGSWTAADATAECDGLVAKADAPLVSAPTAAAPAPLLVPAPSMETRKISFSSEELFDFDKAELRPEGKGALNKLAAELKGVDYKLVTVNGHTDRIGSTAYNQKLSERRANAVQTYLVSSQIKSERITSAGMGETKPITKSGVCTGPMSKKLVACLQPDRRVEVDVQGTKEVTLTR